jgi:antitoxin (DNA-binding transcriptional repressor) of toxin-antitoxin stability system
MPVPTENSQRFRRVGIREFRGNLNAFLKEVEGGQTLVLTSHHKVVAEIRPPSQTIVARAPGALRGKIKMAQDFDMMPEADLKAMESGD